MNSYTNGLTLIYNLRKVLSRMDFVKGVNDDWHVYDRFYIELKSYWGREKCLLEYKEGESDAINRT